MKKLLAVLLLAFAVSCFMSVPQAEAKTVKIHKKHHRHHRHHHHRHHRHHRKVTIIR